MTTFEGRERVAQITLDRPDMRNALGRAHVDDLLDQIERAEVAAAQVIVLNATGPVFCSGADTRELAAGPPRSPSAQLVEAVRGSSAYWIAAVGGPALGSGIELLSACHHVVCASDAWFSLPEFRHDIFPNSILDAIAQQCGPRFALGLARPGARVSAAAALAAGLVDEVVELPELAVHVAARAAAVAEFPRFARAAAQWWSSALDRRG